MLLGKEEGGQKYGSNLHRDSQENKQKYHSLVVLYTSSFSTDWANLLKMGEMGCQHVSSSSFEIRDLKILGNFDYKNYIPMLTVAETKVDADNIIIIGVSHVACSVKRKDP
ncbi:5235_t:CDS:1 [Acaulospora colombiana]|uniref:5235_t:CDS:1 n=1 Tax=Acaulospora colombiana TaxID=27376 RepID=A0ACA9MHM5_9GLOM|nr:5235_t:CDS:1 [Acaulospora colombiana]